MRLFYNPEIKLPLHTLSEEESKHCIRVLRLSEGDRLHLTDGRGTLYTARVSKADPKKCQVEITGTTTQYGRRGYGLTMAVAPTKSSDRFEWFLEKATEVGCDVFIPLESTHSERRVFKSDRAERIVAGAMKQSLKAYLPELQPLTQFAELVTRPFDGIKLIAHCGEPVAGKSYIEDLAHRGDNILILIGPEGDFSPEEVNFAVANGLREITLGDMRLRTETAALMAVMNVAFINR